MKKTRFHGQFFSIPNILSYVRFAMIPTIVWVYCGVQNYVLAAILMTVSGATDIVDGWIARHFQMITDWGKIVDPIADKLTQIAIAFCLAWRFVPMRYLLVLLVLKELYMGIIGMVFIHKTDTVEGSVWYGKMTTVLFFLVTITLVLVPDLPDLGVLLLVLTESAAIILSMILYTARYLRLYKAMQTSVEPEKN
ncbi:MAG: CDP-alcohol phosphatidyltransferase family protein [Clostridia bacterium]|nr:CDP-alcohol phosphatidyltransferase family protein [Clostridia bacterium]